MFWKKIGWIFLFCVFFSLGIAEAARKEIGVIQPDPYWSSSMQLTKMVGFQAKHIPYQVLWRKESRDNYKIIII